MPIVGNNGGQPYNPQAIINQSPAGSTFTFAQGDHRFTRGIVPRNGDIFEGATPANPRFGIRPTSRIDGCNITGFLDPGGNNNLGTVGFAFAGGYANAANDVTIRDLEIHSFAGRYQHAAIEAGHVGFTDQQLGAPGDPADILAPGGLAASLARQGRRWIIEDCFVHSNRCTGIAIQDGGIVRRNLVSHNGQNGIVSYVGDDIQVIGNEVAWNNTDQHGAIDEGGGSKFKFTNRILIRGNYFHHNWGYGIWTDIRNDNVRIEQNIVTDNQRAGIFQEIGMSATIDANYVARCGIDSNSWGFEAGIQMSSCTGDYRVTNNIVEECHNGITIVYQCRPSFNWTGQYGLPQPGWVTDSVTVTGNTIRDSGWTGIFTDLDFNSGCPNNPFYSTPFPGGQNTPSWFQTLNPLVWNFNTYIGNNFGPACNTSEFYADSANDTPNNSNSTPRTWPQWQALGFDANGSFTP